MDGKVDILPQENMLYVNDTLTEMQFGDLFTPKHSIHTNTVLIPSVAVSVIMMYQTARRIQTAGIRSSIKPKDTFPSKLAVIKKVDNKFTGKENNGPFPAGITALP